MKRIRTGQLVKERVKSEWNEFSTDDGYWMLLNAGWNLDGASVIHESTRAACLARLSEVKQGEPF